MDLPIDHFRLLGVGPASDAQEVLRTLAQRLDRIPHEGFTAETLRAREELLRSSADLLCDADRRAAYESDLTSLEQKEEPVVPALDVPTSKEVGGLLLLLEARQPLECFEQASRALQPPQAPALGSGREADLALLAGLAAREGAAELSEQRHYQAAAGILQQGLQMLQRMGQLPELREALSRELELLTPYRVLDLLSRDLAAGEERSEGLALLEQLVTRRGGLEGDADPNFPFADFQAFFRQIRSYLTVQEQVDLFSRWAQAGSEAADFLATTALTASGFARRKPEQIAAARDRLIASGRKGVEPLLANLHLLLGEVELARARFAAGAGNELKAWAARRSSEPLGQLCAYCRDWLQRDVLPGYRDLEGDPDLDAYFSDRDVVAYVEKEDRRQGRAPAAAGSGASARPVAAASPFGSGFGSTLGGGFGSSLGMGSGSEFGGGFSDSAFGSGGFSSGGYTPGGLSSPPAPAADDDALEDDDELVPLGGSLPEALRRRGWLIAAIGGAVALLLAGAWLLRQRQPSPPAPKPAEKGSVAQPKPATAAAGDAPATAKPLTSEKPSEQEIRGLLEAWLAAKAAVLAGGEEPASLDRIARPGPIGRLRGERARDRDRGQTQQVNVAVKDLRIEERSRLRIAATAELAYSDATRDGDGKVVERTAPTTLRNEYVFGRDGDTWRLAATSAAD
ncbi:MAG: IMS domain-containing protein [Synechococcaceae cyanobacterium]|nr:IMS domain-containing protein [Synechococcaceae cyanobacterium]